MAEERVSAQARQRQKENFLVKFLRAVGVLKEPATCKGLTRQAVPCKRQAIRGGYCRLHAPVPQQKKY
jgi:hypothetical protein